MLPTLLVTLLAFLVDILLFAPHQSWGTWIVLAAVILIAVSDGLTCCMRRTLVSRKARKKRIAENAEMSGENFYSRQNTIPTAPPLSQAPTAPMVNGAPGANTLPAFATFEQKSAVLTDDDRTPLNSRSPTAVSGSTTMRPSEDNDGLDRYGMGAGRGAGNMHGRGGRFNGPVDQYGNPLPPSGALPGRRMSGDYPRRMPSNETMNSQGSRGRGRGGYPPRGYPRGGPYGGRGGPMNGGRGGPVMGMGSMAAGVGVGMMAGEAMGRGQRGPPPGYSNGYGPQGRGGPGQGPYGPSYAGPGAYARRQSPGPPSNPGYGRQPSPGPPSNPGYGRQPSPGPPSNPGAYGFSRGLPSQDGDGTIRAESPPPLPEHDPNSIGHAIPMDANTGSPAQTPGFPPPNNPLRDSDSEVQGLVGLQQSRADAPHHSQASSAYSSHPK